jgi:hypothetical protein
MENSCTNCVINVYPLSRKLSSQQKEVKDGLVMFTVRDKCLLGADKFLAEGFVSFADITNTDSRVKLENMEQLHLKLNHPADLGILTFASSTSGFLFL